MLVFATSGNGGAGRSVTSCNVAYRLAVQGNNVCYLDFDFGSPTAGAVLQVSEMATSDGLHSFLLGRISEPSRVDVWSESQRGSMRTRPRGIGELVLLPGDVEGGEVAASPEVVQRCAELLFRLEEEFDICLIDLSAGRSYAAELVLAATADPRQRRFRSRWLVFHRRSRQHILTAAALVFGPRGIVETGVGYGHDRQALLSAIRFVQTMVLDPRSPEFAGFPAPLIAWLHDCDSQLQQLAGRLGVGRALLLGSVPMDPVLQLHEQLITDNDVIERRIASRQTVEAFTALGNRLLGDEAWVVS